MTFPTVPTVGAGRVVQTTSPDTTATRTSANLSTLTKNSGDLLICIFVAYQSTGTAGAVWSGWTAGWTEFMDASNATGMAIGAAYKWSTGSETGIVQATEATTITGHAVSLLLSIPGAHATTPPAGTATLAQDTAAAAVVPALNPTAWDVEDTLWIAVGGGGEVNTTGSFTGVAATNPTNFTDVAVTSISADVAGGVNAAVAFRQLTAASAGGTETFSVDTSNARNCAALIAVRPAPSVTNFNVTGTVTGTGAATATITVGSAAAFTVTARHVLDAANSSAQTGTTNSVTPTANSLLLAFYGTENDGHTTLPTLGAPTGGGLTYTLVNKAGDASALNWDTTTDFNAGAACYRAQVGASPSAFALTCDAHSGTQIAFYVAGAIDITGHDTTTPIVQQKVNGVGGFGPGDTQTGTVTLDAAPTAGNLLVVAFMAGADTGGAFTAPTAGSGKTMTQHLSQNNGGFVHLGIWSRVCDGTESATITCPDLGNQVGVYIAHAIEIRPAGGATNYNITGTVTGTGVATATALVDRPMTATVTGTGAATATITVGTTATNYNVTGTVTGTGAATASATTDRPVAGTVTGTGAATATAVVNRFTTATATGTGAATATATVGAFATGTVTGTGAAAATVVVDRATTASVTGTGAATATISVQSGSGVTGTVTGTGAATAQISVASSVTGTVTGVGAAAATVAVAKTTTATVTGTGAASAVVAVDRPTTGTVTGTGVAAATATLGRFTAATVTGTGAATATVTVDRPVTATVTGTGAATATITVSESTTGTVTGTGAATAVVTVNRNTTATVTGTGAATATIAVGSVGTLTGVVTGTGAATASITTARSVTGTVTGTGAATAQASLGKSTTGSVTGTGAASATVTVDKAATATVTGTGSATATIVVAKFATAAVTGTGAATATITVEAGKYVTGSVVGTGAATATITRSATFAGAVVGTGLATAIIYIGEQGEPVPNPSVSVVHHDYDVALVRHRFTANVRPYAGDVRVLSPTEDS